MTEQFTPLERVEWRSTPYLWDEGQPPQYWLTLPRPLADWDVYQKWERERIDSMRDHLTKGMCLFDVGTEQGWCNVVYARMVGGENMVLIEPTPNFWPNIKATWEKNNLWGPRGFYDGLVSDVTTDTRTGFRDWPASSDGPLIDRNKYQYIHDNGDGIPEIRLDDLVLRMGVVPDAITIDVEGAELLVLRGAERTLRERHPLVWVSIHPDMMLRDYDTDAESLHAFMADHGYTGEYLATDHEEHWFFHA